MEADEAGEGLWRINSSGGWGLAWCRGSGMRNILIEQFFCLLMPSLQRAIAF